MHKRPNDQYKIARAPEMIEQLEKEKQKPKCTYSTVRNYRYLEFNGHFHAGTLSHICNLEKEHEKDEKTQYCKCTCGVQWLGWG